MTCERCERNVMELSGGFCDLCIEAMWIMYQESMVE